MKAAISACVLVAACVAASATAQTLETPRSATDAPDDDGFLRRWLILEPIRASGQLAQGAVRMLVNTEHFPQQLTRVPRAGETVTVGDETLEWHAVETKNYNVNLYHFAREHGKPTSNVLFFAVTIVDTPRTLRDARLAICSNAASVWWIDGEEVIGIYDDRQSVIDDGVSKRLTLSAGRHEIRAAVVNGGGATDFCARLLDENLKPVTDIVVRLDGRQGASVTYQ